jgi:asparagine synthase (glutamine-hydrolysing)
MIEPDHVLRAFDDWVGVFDEPFGDQAALPTLLLAQLARRSVTVVLTGEGADELFAGYANYSKRLREERITAWLGARWSPLPAVLPYLPARWRKDRILKAAARPLAQRYVTIPNIFDAELRQALLSPALRGALRERLSQYAERYFLQCDSRHYLDRILYVDARLWLPDDLLTKVDRATMAHSLEARVPYLDHRLFEVCAALHPRLKQAGGTQKHVLKRVAEKYLPHDLVHRRKQGFVMPLRHWLGGTLQSHLRHCLSAQGLAKRNLFAAGALDTLLGEHESGKRDHSTRLWALLVLELWFQRYEPDFAL